ncbi:MAG: cache domain-containing protein [candidate division KSB1 bacterium]|nr:cache domain-containing protein [candidate division KSB1 bacterium]
MLKIYTKSLRVTLTVAFLALSVVVLLITSSLTMYFNFRNQQKLIANEQQLIAQHAANTVRSFVQEKLSELEATVHLGNLVTIRQAEQKTVLEKLLGFDPAFRQLLLINTQKQELAKVSRLSNLVSYKFTRRVVESEMCSLINQDKPYISPVYIDEITSEPMVIMVVPVTDVFGDVKGTLMAEVNLKFLWDLVGNLQVGETGLAYVVDRQGNLIAFGDIARVLRGENVGNLKEVREFINTPFPVDKTTVSISKGINGTTIVGTYVPLRRPDWAVVTELPVTEAYREVIRSAAISVGVMVIVALGAGLMAVYVARRLAKPLLNLTETTARIAGGERQLQAAVEGPTEVVSLARAFNSMTAQLRTLIDGLEQRVAERTRDLQRRGQELEALQEISLAIASQLKLDELLQNVVEKGCRLLDVRAGSVYLFDKNKGDLELVISHGFQRDRKGTHLSPGEGIAGKVLQRGAPLTTDNYRQWEGRSPNWDTEPLTAVLGVPLKHGDQITGVLSFAEISRARKFDEHDIWLATLFANQAAIAIENARLYQQAQQEITERVRAETALKTYAARLEQSNRQLQDFAYIASHDLQEPLRKVQAFGDRLRAKYGEVLGEQGQDYLGRMQNATQRMQNLIDGLLMYSRVTTRAQPFVRVNLAQVVQEVLSDLETRIEQTGGRVEVGALPTIEADPMQMHQLLQNLISNALKFHRQEVAPVVKVYEQVTDQASANGVCHLLVEDNGIGFEEKYVERIFGLFQRLHGRDQYEGTGIGLAICRKIVERHGGSLTAKSTPGQGSTFIITLPVKQKKEERKVKSN